MLVAMAVLSLRGCSSWGWALTHLSRLRLPHRRRKSVVFPPPDLLQSTAAAPPAAAAAAARLAVVVLPAVSIRGRLYFEPENRHVPKRESFRHDPD